MGVESRETPFSSYLSSRLVSGVVDLVKVDAREKFTPNTVVIKPLFCGICRADVKEVSGSRDIPGDYSWG